jgi:ABC-2 type transport system permease protein
VTLAWAFFKRDALIAYSYRVSFVAQLLGNLLVLGLFYYVGRAVGDRPLPAFDAYGGHFVAFLLIGVALTDCVGVSLMSFAAQVREAQTTGTLEATVMAPVRLPLILLYSSLWTYFLCTVRFVLYLVVGSWLYGLDLSRGNLATALLIFALTVLCFMGVGILWAGIVMLIKRGESLMTVAASLVLLLSGVLYPVHLLPGWLQDIGSLVPLTHALEGMRLALLTGATIAQLQDTLLILGAFAVVLLGVGFGAFDRAVAVAQHTGSLTQY